MNDEMYNDIVLVWSLCIAPIHKIVRGMYDFDIHWLAQKLATATVLLSWLITVLCMMWWLYKTFLYL